MASAGRILIIPKGNWDEETEYNMLDLVFHNEASWIGKRASVGKEPTEDNKDDWMKMCGNVDLTEVLLRIAALESQMLGTISLDDIDLTSYATKDELINYLNKSSGGTLNGDLRLEKTLPRLQLKNTVTSRTLTIESGETGISSFGNYNSNSDQTNLQLRKSSEGLSELLRVAVDGSKSYRLFGEHNLPLLKETIFKSKVFNGTTDSNGVLKPGELTVTDTDVFFCRLASGIGFCTQYNDNGTWAYRIENADRTPIANQPITIKVVYLVIL